MNKMIVILIVIIAILFIADSMNQSIQNEENVDIITFTNRCINQANQSCLLTGNLPGNWSIKTRVEGEEMSCSDIANFKDCRNFLRTKSIEALSFNVKNWDEDTETDGFDFLLKTIDMNGRLLKTIGVLNMELFDTTGDIGNYEKGNFLKNLTVTFSPDNYTSNGASIRFDFGSKELKSQNGVGLIEITFTDNNGNSFTTEGFVQGMTIPAYEELVQLYEQLYLKSAKNLSKGVEENRIVINVTRAGFFTTRKHLTMVEEVTKFRVDFFMTNTGSNTEDFNAGTALIRTDDGEYKYDTGVFGGVTKSMFNITRSQRVDGYILFKDVPANISGSAEIALGTIYFGIYDIRMKVRVDL